MKKAIKLLFLGGPAVLLLGVVGCQTVDAVRIDAGSLPPADVRWGEGESAISVKVTEEEGETEILTFHVEALDARGEPLARRSLDVDRDQWGGGFVRAMQVDDDPDLEVVAWGLHESGRTAFYLDHEDGAVAVQPFSQASPAARSRALERHQVHRVNASGVVMLFLLGFAYYGLFAFVRVIDHVTSGAGPRTDPPLPEGETS